MSKNGGPAFPVQNANYTEAYGGAPGMTLRDWLAGQTLLSRINTVRVFDRDFKEVAKDAYALADAMLAAREVSP